MAIYDDKHQEFLSILERQRFMPKSDWEKDFNIWLENKLESLNLNNKNISGNLIQPYLASMRYGSKEAMDRLMDIGFNPTYQLLHKRLSILSEYLNSSDVLSADIVKHHLSNISNFYGDLSERQQEKKIFDYVNQAEPFLGQDALITVCKRKSYSSFENKSPTEKDLIDCLKIIMASGADISRSDRNNYTALHWSIIEGNPRVAINLIRNSDVEGCVAYNNSYETPMSLAAKNGQREVIIGLFRKGVLPSGYQCPSVKNNFPPGVKQKLDQQNPLLLALRGQKIDIASDLVSFGGRFEATSNLNDMHTGLIYAAKLMNPDLMKRMLKQDYSPNEVNSHGFTPLLYLVSYLKSQPDSKDLKTMISDLIEKGASLEVISKNGTSSLDILESMARNGHEYSMKLLYDRNLEKMIDFVQKTSDLKIIDIKDLNINDEQMAAMRSMRVENISSVWLNRDLKTDQYKETILATGKTSFKDIIASPFIGGASVYGILKGVGEYIESHKDIPFIDYVDFAVQNASTITVICSVLAASFVAYNNLTDETKKYALGFWMKKTSSEIIEKYVDPVISRLDSCVSERFVRVKMFFMGVKSRIEEIGERISNAVGVLSGRVKISNEVTDITEDLGLDNTVKFPVRDHSSEDRSQDVGMG